MYRVAALVALLPFALAARADLRLPDAALVTPPACDVAPLVEAGLTQPIAAFTRTCPGRRVALGIDGPRDGAPEHTPSLLRARFSRVATERFGAMLATLKLVWAGASDAAQSWRARSDEAVFAASEPVPVEPRFAVRAQLGLDMANAARNRTRLAGSWSPSERTFMAAEPEDRQPDRAETHALGLRWWVVPRRVAFDLAARWVPGDSGTTQPTVGLVLPGLGP